MKVYIGGLGLRGDGYPNAARTIELLERKSNVEIIHCGNWLPDNLHIWKLAQMPMWKVLPWLVRLVFGNLLSLARICIRVHDVPGIVYVPYPGLFFLLWASLLPRCWRPRCIVDSYVSIWDSSVRDRAISKIPSFAATMLKRIEARALKAASLVLVDTRANQDFFISEFEIDSSRVVSIPLLIDEERICDAISLQGSKRIDGRIRILFVGTLIPLHGIKLLLEAFANLGEDKRFELKVIGQGQQSDLVIAFIAAHPSLQITWVREWYSLERIAIEIAEADICMGIFGGDGKASRVLPFKIYMYMAVGKPIISQSSYALPGYNPTLPIISVANVSEIIDAVKTLADDRKLRLALSKQSRKYYEKWLSNARAMTIWNELLKLEI